MPGGAQGCSHLRIPGLLGGAEQRAGEIELHLASIAEAWAGRKVRSRVV